MDTPGSRCPNRSARFGRCGGGERRSSNAVENGKTPTTESAFRHTQEVKRWAVGGILVAAIASAAVPAAARDAAPAATADPLGVYFRHDAVGRNQVALAITSCGSERWSVKTATDDDRHHIAAGVRDTKLRSLRRKTTPPSRPDTARVT